MIDIQKAIAYDIETLPNVFTLSAVGIFNDVPMMTFEISHFRDERDLMLQWFRYWHENVVPMIGFNNIAFDYAVLHFIWNNPNASVEEIYAFAMELIQDFTRRIIVWESDRFAPQIDLFKIHHFDNRAKSTSLKALEVNMRSESVLEMPIPFNEPLLPWQVDKVLIPYNRHDVSETKKFALISMDAIKFRIGLSETLQGDVLNFNDTKIGAKILEQRLGDDLCYTRENGYREPRQTIRHEIRLNDIILPYIEFNHPEFQRVLSWMRQQILTGDELDVHDTTIKTKGVFSGVKAHVGGIDFHFGTGGIHGSVEAQRIAATDEMIIDDIDVTGLYPAIAIVNGLYPEHLGDRFVVEYARLPVERALYKKGTVQNASFKLASNGTYGNSNNKFSVFYDPKFTMTITINGQLLLCMLAEWLLNVSTLQIIQINTDGITYRVHKDRLEHARLLQRQWQRLTGLVLEDARYSRMWIRDVNNYVAEGVDGKLKQKGAYWYPKIFPDDISNSSPPAWHKDFSAVVCTMAAVEHMTKGTPIADFIYAHREKFDFMCRAKVDRSSKLMIGETEVQRITRYFLSHNGDYMKKISPPAKGNQVGDFKRKNGLSESDYWNVANTIPLGQWDERIHTKNKSRYIIREMSIESGYRVTECNHASNFSFEHLNYDWYIEQAQKLVIA